MGGNSVLRLNSLRFIINKKLYINVCVGLSREQVRCMTHYWNSRPNVSVKLDASICQKLFDKTLKESIFFQEPTRRTYSVKTITSVKADRNYSRDKIGTYLDEIALKQEINDSDWESLWEKVLLCGNRNINSKNVETVIMRYIVQRNVFHLCKSYFKYLINRCRHVENINIVTKSLYLKANYNCWKDHDKEDEKLVESICKEIKSKLPYLEFNTTECLVYGLCCLKKWKECTDVMNVVKDYYQPSSTSYATVIKTAIANNDIEFGWKLLEEKLSAGWDAHHSIYEVFVDKFNDDKRALSKLLHLFSKYNEKPDANTANKLLEAVKQLPSRGNLTPAITHMFNDGTCKNCKNSLQSGRLSRDEFEKLRSSFVNPLIVGKDIFLKSTPDELNRFQRFLEDTSPYDYVLDGLNIAYSVGFKNHTNDTFAKALKTVVKFLVDGGKKVMVLGRSHMKNWPTSHIDYINTNAHLFLAENMSEDDPYLLYATLYSGMNTCFVSRDLMRSHKYLLSLHDPQLNDLFWRWQCQHQHTLIHINLNDGRVFLKQPVMYLQRAQYLKEKSVWHVPYHMPEDANTPGHKKFTMKTWLCIPNL